jgi:hypothetical protein
MEDNEKSRYGVVNLESGEVSPMYPKKNSSIYITKSGKLNLPEEDGFYMQINTPEYSSASFYKYYLILSKRIMMGTSVLGYTTGGRPKLLRKEDIMDILGIGDRTFRNFIKESNEKQIMTEKILKKDSYAINPYFARNGIKFNLTEFNYWVAESDLFFNKIKPRLGEIKTLLNTSSVDVEF